MKVHVTQRTTTLSVCVLRKSLRLHRHLSASTASLAAPRRVSQRRSMHAFVLQSYYATEAGNECAHPIALQRVIQSDVSHLQNSSL
ncbi:hypothetical protein EVAR_76023_1 [Eumeta japonica]|uniref:Uncharacterized protein n=1 Tax=Eumeta variegata TaxID=151549 RepID=A0A4C1UAH2_EUMVA|nr:hypothetical protein EVAR_76023_1 [Eumeta japonica]